MIPSSKDPVETDRARAPRHEVQKDKAVEDSPLTAVFDRPETPRLMSKKVGKRHLSAGEEGSPGRIESNHDQTTGHQFDHTGRPSLREQLHRFVPGEHSEHLLDAMEEEGEPNDDASDGKHDLRDTSKWFHSGPIRICLPLLHSTVAFRTLRTFPRLPPYTMVGRHGMTRQTLWMGTLLVGSIVTVALTSAQEAQSWLHLQIEGGGENEGNVAVNLPLQAVGAVMAMTPDNIISPDGHLVVAEEHGLSVSGLRQVWQGVKDAGDAEFVTLREETRVVRVERAGDQIKICIQHEDEVIRVDLPLALVDALLSGEGETLNLAAALDQLNTLRGDIVRVTEEERQIRVWVDEKSVQ